MSVSQRQTWLVVAGIVAALVIGWFAWAGPVVRHKRWSDRVRDDVWALAQRRPPDLPHGAWEYLVGWTINLHANCGSIPGTVDDDWRAGFAAELERRLAGQMSVADIDWIWDEYAAHTKYGPSYSDKYRPTHDREYLTAEVGCCGIRVD